MNKLTLATLAALGLAASGTLVRASEPTKLWETNGFTGPESALIDGGILYVSTGNGDPVKKDGDGAIAKVGLDGKVIDAKWATGLNAPKGLRVSNGHLFAGDVDELVEIDLKDGHVIAKHVAPGGKLLNDVAVDAKGAVYVSDTLTNTIYRYADGKIEAWLKDDKLAGPNGLFVDGDTLIVNTWGVLTGEGFNTSTPGALFAVSLADRSIKDISAGKSVGNLDGLEPLGGGAYINTDFLAGKVLSVAADGSVKEVLALTKGSADLGYDVASHIAYVPNMLEGKLAAYKLP